MVDGCKMYRQDVPGVWMKHFIQLGCIFYYPPPPPPPSPLPPKRDLMCGAGSLGSHSHTVNGLNKPEGGGADAFVPALQKNILQPASKSEEKHFTLF